LSPAFLTLSKSPRSALSALRSWHERHGRRVGFERPFDVPLPIKLLETFVDLLRMLGVERQARLRFLTDGAVDVLIGVLLNSGDRGRH